jgi:hypothetical protein
VISQVPTIAPTASPMCVDEPAAGLWCYIFDFENSEDDGGVASDDNASSAGDDDGWRFDDSASGGGIAIIVTPTDNDGGSAAYNITLGCDDDDVASWELDWQLEDGCYSMTIAGCDGSDALASLSGDLVGWFSSSVGVSCDGLPCDLAFCADSGVISPASTIVPTIVPSISSAPTSLTPFPTVTPLPTWCVDNTDAGLHCYYFDFGNGGRNGDDASGGDANYYYYSGDDDLSANGDDGSDLVGNDDALDDTADGGSNDDFAADDIASDGDGSGSTGHNDDGWSFGEDDAAHNAGIRVVMTGAFAGVSTADALVLNMTFGCNLEGGEDDVEWVLVSQMENGCYSMAITTACGAGHTASIPPVTGDLVTWLTEELELSCGGLPCSLAFCADSGIVYPVPTPSPTTAPTISMCVDNPAASRWCYTFDFENSENDGTAADDASSVDDVSAGDGGSTGDDDGWRFDDRASGGGIVIIVTPADDDGGLPMYNVTIGCDDDDVTYWELDWQLEDGCYSMTIAGCGGTDALTSSSGDLVGWFSSSVGVSCDGLPCDLAFCADSGAISPVPTIAPTTLPTVSCIDDVAAELYCYHFDFNNGDAGSDGSGTGDDGGGDDDDENGAGVDDGGVGGTGSGYYYYDGDDDTSGDDGSDLVGDDDVLDSGDNGINNSGDDATSGEGGTNGSSGDDAVGAADDGTNNDAGDDSSDSSNEDDTNNDAWSFGDDDLNDGNADRIGIRVIVLGADAEQASRRLASNALINATFGCKGDAADDDATWELFSKLANGCYEMGIASCGSGSDDDSTSAAYGDLVTWLTNELEIVCNGLPCSLPFCADSGIIYPAPTAEPTTAPVLDGESYSYSYNVSYIAGAEADGGSTGGILVATTLGMPGWVWAGLLLLLLLLLCCCCIFFLLCCGGGKKRKESFVPMVPAEATIVTVEGSGGAVARRQIMRGPDLRGAMTTQGANAEEAAFNPMVLQGAGGERREPTGPTPTVARVSCITVEGAALGSRGNDSGASDDFVSAEQGLATHRVSAVGGSNPMHRSSVVTHI